MTTPKSDYELGTSVQNLIQLSESSDIYCKFDLAFEHIWNITHFYCDKLSEVLLCRIDRDSILDMNEFDSLIRKIFIDGYILHYCFQLEKGKPKIIADDLTDDEANRLLNEYIQPLLLGGEKVAGELLDKYPNFETVSDIIICYRVGLVKILKEPKLLPILIDGLNIVITTGLALRHYFFEVLSSRIYHDWRTFISIIDRICKIGSKPDAKENLLRELKELNFEDTLDESKMVSELTFTRIILRAINMLDLDAKGISEVYDILAEHDLEEITISI